ncbi:MAG: aquaporin family protein [Armatimonadetes bacterium]|nr:aquaporin family protein [Armatimonadota bacterium]
MKKRLLAEFLGTFGIVFAPVALSATSALPSGAGGLVPSAFVSGAAVLAMIAAFGPVSAAHFNPAVTLGFAVAGRFDRREVLPYWLAQFAGGLAAAVVVALLFGPGHGTHVPTGSIAQNFGIEVLITFLLMLVIMAVATDKRVPGTTPPVAIGTIVVVGVLVGGPLTGGSMNPARSLGPDLVAGGNALPGLWLYLTAPLVGAALAALLYEAVRVDKDAAVSAPAVSGSDG